MKIVKKHGCHGGQVLFVEHQSKATGTPMVFSVFLPPATEQGGKHPALFWLSGLTCTAENFTTKAGYQQRAAERGMIVVAPDTSPRGANVPGEDDSYDLGTGAGFYVNATQAPWAANYKMYDYVVDELFTLVTQEFPVDPQRCGISGHSMGGHGALVLGLRNPNRFKSVSAFSPITAPMSCPWGQKAFTAYLGDDTSAWKDYDASVLVNQIGYKGTLLIDQGANDEFLEEQLMPETFKEAAEESGTMVNLRYQAGYDHSYYFIQTFIGEHLKFHSDNLR